MQEETRCYVFVHSFLSAAQKAVQSTHVVAEMVSKYYNGDADSRCALLRDWVHNDKTLILLEGGNSDRMMSLLSNFFAFRLDSYYPFASFEEDEATLEKLLTGFCFVAPERVYGASAGMVPLGSGDRWLRHTIDESKLLLSGS